MEVDFRRRRVLWLLSGIGSDKKDQGASGIKRTVIARSAWLFNVRAFAPSYADRLGW